MLFSSSSSPAIFGCSGYTLTSAEKVFFKKNNPLGFILFKRNIQDRKQLKSLIEELKSTLQQANPLILIDQEGGRVARLTSPHWFHPPASMQLVKGSFEDSKKQVYETYARIAKDLKEMGITANCAPVLDLDVADADPIMGDRTFSDDPHIVSELGAVAINALQKGGIIPIMKHIPGHGAATCDSHEALPVITLSSQELQPHFKPFKVNAHCPWAMTAHIIYAAIDPHHPATQSPLVIQDIIRKQLGFQGFLMSDDLGMKALTGSFEQRAQTSLEAGCDAVLHCSGIMEEMFEVMKGVLAFSSLSQQQEF
ncbi:MAG: beta-N-acetylhexosaminidase [Alphaproteobacteria bacterium]|nr:beta-N-acetylhexosaminidase [Alphaproteobacteria bacterium]